MKKYKLINNYYLDVLGSKQHIRVHFSRKISFTTHRDISYRNQ